MPKNVVNDDEETHIECVVREFIEETGYEIKIGRYIGKDSCTTY